MDDSTRAQAEAYAKSVVLPTKNGQYTNLKSRLVTAAWLDGHAAGSAYADAFAEGSAEWEDEARIAKLELAEARAQLAEYEKILKRYAPQTLTVINGRARLNFDGDAGTTGPKMYFEEGETWRLGDHAAETLARYGKGK
jgi:hypothetical protein